MGYAKNNFKIFKFPNLQINRYGKDKKGILL